MTAKQLENLQPGERLARLTDGHGQCVFHILRLIPADASSSRPDATAAEIVSLVAPDSQEPQAVVALNREGSSTRATLNVLFTDLEEDGRPTRDLVHGLPGAIRIAAEFGNIRLVDADPDAVGLDAATLVDMGFAHQQGSSTMHFVVPDPPDLNW